MNSKCCRGVFAAVLGSLTAPAFALSVGMVDTFQGGLTDGWASGPANPNPPVNVANGGPLGIGDGYLQITSTGTPPSGTPTAGGKLVAFSGPQWAGDYIGTGVTAIDMDVSNLGATDLDLRLAFQGSSGTALSTDAIQVAAGSGWTRLSFPVDPGALTGPAVAALSGVTQFRLYHSPSAVFVGPAIEAQLGVDNITAVPEAGTGLMLVAGLATLVASKNLRRRRSW